MPALWNRVDWWDLPGPARFVAKMAEAIAHEDGVYCVRLPDPSPQGLLEAVQRHVEHETTRRFILADASNGLGRRGPAHWLADQMASTATGIRSAADFLDAPDLQDVGLLVHGIPDNDWRSWMNFLRLLRTERSRAQRPFAPSLLVVPPVAAPKGDLLSVFGRSGLFWSGKVTRLDMQLYLAALTAWPDGSEIAERVAAACIVETAGWDRNVASALATQPLSVRLDPREALVAFAATLPHRHPTWANGLVDSWDGRAFESAVSVARRADRELLGARIWRAQASVLFPFLEQVRRAFVARHHTTLEAALPFEKPFLGGRVQIYSEPERLEFFDLHRLIKAELPHVEEQFLRACMRLRGNLAHMDPATAPQIEAISSFWEANGENLRQECHGWDWPRHGQRLVLLVGPSGAGKSTYALATYASDEVVSSDAIRTEMYGGMQFDGPQDEVFRKLREEVVSRLASGRSVVVDATNLRRADRLSNAMLAPQDIPVRYVVIDRAMEGKVSTGGWRNDHPGLMQSHQVIFENEIEAILDGDGLPNVVVTDLRTSIDNIRLPRATCLAPGGSN